LGTRAAYGIRSGHQDKITYNHFDGYPSYLGINIMSFIHDTPDKELREIADRIEMVQEDSKPSAKQIKQYKQYADLNVSSQSLTDWYCLLRETQGDLTPYKNGLTHIIDSHDFLKDSLFCEWAYIINVDKGELEIYRGFNTKKHVKGGGRYCRFSVDDNPQRGNKYYGVTILATLKLSEIREMTPEAIKQWCEALEKSVYEGRN